MIHEKVIEMGIRPVDRDELLHLLASKLRNDWVLLLGDLDVMGWLERQVYLPPDGKNDDYEMISGKGTKGLFHIQIGKKLRGLSRF